MRTKNHTRRGAKTRGEAAAAAAVPLAAPISGRMSTACASDMSSCSPSVDRRRRHVPQLRSPPFERMKKSRPAAPSAVTLAPTPMPTFMAIGELSIGGGGIGETEGLLVMVAKALEEAVLDGEAPVLPLGVSDDDPVLDALAAADLLGLGVPLCDELGVPVPVDVDVDVGVDECDAPLLAEDVAVEVCVN